MHSSATESTEIKFRGYHLDLYGHVNNARYLEFLEEGRWAFIENNCHLSKWPEGISFFVVNININYRKPASMGDVLEIRTTISHLGHRSGKIHQDIFLKGTEIRITDADVTFVIVDSKTGKALPLKGELLEFLRKAAGSKSEDSPDSE